jgi:hypothetical protein
MSPISNSFVPRGLIGFIGASCPNLFIKGAAGSKVKGRTDNGNWNWTNDGKIT